MDSLISICVQSWNCTLVIEEVQKLIAEYLRIFVITHNQSIELIDIKIKSMILKLFILILYMYMLYGMGASDFNRF